MTNPEETGRRESLRQLMMSQVEEAVTRNTPLMVAGIYLEIPSDEILNGNDEHFLRVACRSFERRGSVNSVSLTQRPQMNGSIFAIEVIFKRSVLK